MIATPQVQMLELYFGCIRKVKKASEKLFPMKLHIVCVSGPTLVKFHFRVFPIIWQSRLKHKKKIAEKCLEIIHLLHNFHCYTPQLKFRSVG